ncbi:MAG: hypothetical protein RLZZ618_2650 [Pseudomonadota bacterium]|jgi:hypothetical protein
MSTPRTTVLVGLALLLGAASLIFAIAGWHGILHIAILCAVGALAAHLWQKESLGFKIMAACLMPALIWARFMSKDTRRAIEQFAVKKAEAEREAIKE